MTGITSASRSPLDVNLIMSNLYQRRTVFCSEADFQYEFAKQIQITYGFQVRCEFPVTINGQKAHIDILAITNNNCAIAIELKYKTRKYTVIDSGTDGLGLVYDLKNQAAQNDGSYNYVKDICRLQSLTLPGSAQISVNGTTFDFVTYFSGGVFGHAVILTNDRRYQKPLPNPLKTFYKHSNGNTIISSGTSFGTSFGWYNWSTSIFWYLNTEV